MSTMHETTMPRAAEGTTPGDWHGYNAQAGATSAVLQVVRVLLAALALAGLVYGGFAAARTLPTGIGIMLGWILVSFVAAPLVGIVLKAATSDNAIPTATAQRGPAGHVPGGSVRD